MYVLNIDPNMINPNSSKLTSENVQLAQVEIHAGVTKIEAKMKVWKLPWWQKYTVKIKKYKIVLYNDKWP